MALSKARNTPRRSGIDFDFPVAADAVIHQGGIVALDSGFADAGSTATDLIAVGRAEDSVDNTGGSNGDKSVPVSRGTFHFNNSAAADEITLADIGSDCFIVDDETVALTDGSGTRSVAGTVRDVDAEGVWVEF